MFIDTHTHLYLPDFENGGADAVRRAVAAGVERMVLPNVDVAGIGPMRSLAAMFPGNISMAMGLHPTEAGGDFEAGLSAVEAEFRAHRSDYCAVGEVGIDLYWDKTFRDAQMQAFERQCQWAVGEDLPVIIHCRDGLDETLEVLSGLPVRPACVFHSFGGTSGDVERIRRVGDFYFGVNGIVTFKNSRLREVLRDIGAERILLETDSPYLTPVPHRGQRNESAYIPHIAACVAGALGVSMDEVAEVTSASACDFFKL